MSNNIKTGNILCCEVKIKQKIYPKNKTHQSGDWCVLTAEVVNVIEGEPKTHPVFETIMITGNFPKFNYKDIYKMLGQETYNEQYKNFSYEIKYFGQPMDLTNEKDQKIFLAHVLTDKQFKNIYDTYNNPFDIIKNQDIESLIKVKGIGTATALNILEKYKNSIDSSAIYVELNDYGLSDKMIDKLIDKYKSPQIVIDKIKDNPYVLATEIDGIGWEKADNIALKSGLNKKSPYRIQSFIQRLLEEEAYDGNSYVNPMELTQVIFDRLEITDTKLLSSVIHDMYDKNILWHNDIDNKTTKVGLMKYYNLEKNICNELKRINEGKNNFKFNNWEDVIVKIEQQQGWNYTEEQKQAIQLSLENQVLMVTGGAGTGKTSVVNGMVKVLKEYNYVQCALSGKASSRMAEVTGEKGYTIHRLLGYTPKGNFIYNKKNPLLTEIVIVDEISMIGGKLFYDLIKAIPTGAKLIVLGDVQQLESIGCMNLAKDILESKYLTSIELTKIHRQAQKSGIITESIKVKDKTPLFQSKWEGHDIRGELKDFEIDVYNNKQMSVKKCLDYFKTYLPKASDITEIQVLVPVKERGEACVYNLNNKIQEIYNPFDKNKNEIKLILNKDKYFTIREGDKILVSQNNYQTVDNSGKNCPIFNGQQGIVKEIDLGSEVMYVDMPYVSDELMVIPKKVWANLLLGYVTTIAKSQGSQFEYVIGCIDYSTPPMMLTKELVYTLITRAKENCTLLGESRALYKAMTTSYVSTKKTFLKEMLDSNIA